jgi:hypothetical protein
MVSLPNDVLVYLFRFQTDFKFFPNRHVFVFLEPLHVSLKKKQTQSNDLPPFVIMYIKYSENKNKMYEFFELRNKFGFRINIYMKGII